MNNYVIYSDSTSDLTRELREKYNISYCPMNVVINGKEHVADLDWTEFSAQEFYNWMRDGVKVSTTLVPAHVYEANFKKELEAGNDILYIACSSKLSGSINVARFVAEELLKEYPERKIIVVDSLRANLAQGALAITASELKEAGKTIEEVRDYLEANILKYSEIATVESLTYLKNAGRVKAGAAFFGNLLGVKPMVLADCVGNNYAFKKVKGRRAALLELINVMKEKIVDPQNQVIYLEHADSTIDGEFVKQHIIDTFNPKDVYVTNIGPITGTSLGPGTIVVSYLSIEETIKGE